MFFYQITLPFCSERLNEGISIIFLFESHVDVISFDPRSVFVFISFWCFKVIPISIVFTNSEYLTVICITEINPIQETWRCKSKITLKMSGFLNKHDPLIYGLKCFPYSSSMNPEAFFNISDPSHLFRRDKTLIHLSSTSLRGLRICTLAWGRGEESPFLLIENPQYWRDGITSSIFCRALLFCNLYCETNRFLPCKI